jgi:catechol 2,3-dioxygenase-like lactoylglutathione lyase family enzyme
MPALDLIGIIVTDMSKSLAFYRRLGLDVPADADAEPHVEVALPGGMRVAWDTLETIRSFDPEYQHPGASAVALAFLMDSPAEVDATYAALAAHGHKAPWDAFWGQRYAILHDPDGNTVDLFAALS